MATQKTIADRLGLSVSLVSRVLSGKADEIGIAADTVQRVLNEAKRTNYAPNSAALTLRGARTNTLGVVAYDFEDPYFGVILSELHKIAGERNFSLVLAGAYKRNDAHIDASIFAKHSVDGLIIVGSDRQKTWLDGFDQANAPIVQIGHTDDKKCANIYVDENSSTAVIAGHLTRTNNRTAALFFTRSLAHQCFRRAHLKTLKAHGIEVIHDFRSDGDAIAEDVSAMRPVPDAVIAGDDIMAIHIIRALHERGLSVPQDVKVIGFDDIPQARNFIPSLTTLRSPIEKIAETAFKLAAGSAQPEESIRFAPELICRESA